MRKSQSPLSATVVGVSALLLLWGVALAGMTALPNGSGVASVGVAEPTGLLISHQDKSGNTAFYRELRAVNPASTPANGPSENAC